MNWLARLFAARRELSRFARRERELSGRIDALEAENRRLASTILERDLAWADRLLTGVVKVPAIADEVKRKVRELTEPDTYDAELNAYLIERQEKLYRDAEIAGATRAAAEEVFKRNKQQYIFEFETLATQESFN